MVDINLSEYNAQLRLTLESTKAVKQARQFKKGFNNSYFGLKRIAKTIIEKKLDELAERENRLKAENPKYKKKFKYQLINEINEETEAKAKRAKAETEAFLKANREFWIENDKRKAETEAYIKEKREKEKEILLSKIKNLKTGSYKISGDDWKSFNFDKGFFYERRKFEGILDFEEFEFLGVWVDEKNNNELFLGWSVWIEDRARAEALARKLGERAIFDCKNKQDIRLDNNF